MGSLFPLQMFPGGFDTSIITVVFVGVLCLWALTETFGFVFVGLVVPGYLASIFIVAPASAITVLVEGLITYALVRFLSDYLGKAGAWSPFFGRDRFFAFVLFSVAVRLVGEMWLWPQTWELVRQLTGRALAPPGPLNSIGLVLVPLAANMFWKVGLRRGLTQLLLPGAVVWLVATTVLLPLTNLHLSGFQLHYEDVAVDFVSSPRAYIILLTAAVLSTRFNLRFGWDFGGILVPALMAVAWRVPFKAMITYVEVLILVGTSTLLMRAPLVRTWNLEGPRKIVLVFTIGFTIKYIGAWVLLGIDPSIHVIDFFAFGYLLSSLLALKTLENGFAQTYLPTLVVSLVGFVLGAGIASGIHTLGLGQVEAVAVGEGHAAPPVVDRAAFGLLRHTALLHEHAPDASPIRSAELDRLEAIGRRANMLMDAPASQWRRLSGPADQLGLQLEELRDAGGGHVFLLAEPLAAYPDDRGWGVYLFRPGAHGPIVEVPTVGGRPTRVLAALAVAEKLDACALLLGSATTAATLREVTPRESALSPFHRMHLALGARRVVELRMRTSKGHARAFVGHRLDPHLSLSALQSVVGKLDIIWRSPHGLDRQREVSQKAFTTVMLDAGATRRAAAAMADLVGSDTAEPSPVEVHEHHVSSLLAFLSDWVLGSDARVARSYAELGHPPLAAELELVERGALDPLVHMSRQPATSFGEQRTLAVAGLSAAAVGLELGHMRADESDECYWTLSENGHPSRSPTGLDEKGLRGFGFALISCEARAPAVLEVPYPLREFSTWRLAALMAGELQARGIIVGSKMRARNGKHALRALDEGSFFASAHRVFQREYLGVGAPWAVQIRGLASDRPLDGDILLSPTRPVTAASPPAGLDGLTQWFERRDVRVVIDRGQREFTGIRGLPDATASYSRRVAGERHVRLWASSELRAALTPTPTPTRLTGLMARRGVAWQQASIVQWMRRPPSEGDAPDTVAPEAFDEGVDLAQKHAEQFATTLNPVQLSQAVDALRSRGIEPAIVLDPGRQQAWLVAEARRQRVALRLQSPGVARGVLALGDAGPVSALQLLLARRVRIDLEEAAKPAPSEPSQPDPQEAP